jgi:hypothetical protein
VLYLPSFSFFRKREREKEGERERERESTTMIIAGVSEYFCKASTEGDHLQNRWIKKTKETLEEFVESRFTCLPFPFFFFFQKREREKEKESEREMHNFLSFSAKPAQKETIC